MRDTSPPIPLSSGALERGRIGSVGGYARAGVRCVALLLLAATLCPSPPPAEAQGGGTLAIRAGRVHTLTGPPLENAVILVRDGRITALGRFIPVPEGVPVYDASAHVVIPGLVAAGSQLGGAADAEEAVTPDLRAADAFDTFADYARLLEGGVTSAYVATGAQRLVSGRGGVVKFVPAPHARLLSEAADLRAVLGEPAKGPPALFRPPVPPTAADPITPAQRQLPSSRPAQLAALRQLFADARRFLAPGNGGAGLSSTDAARLRALEPVLAGELPLRVNAHRAVDILAALRFAEEQEVRLVIEGGTEAYRVADELARREVAVVAQSPLRFGEPVAADFTRATAHGEVNPDNIALLARAGVEVALAPPDDGQLPHLLLLAAAEVGRGLSPEAALRLVTAGAAELLGVGERVGSIAPGREADLLILDGDPLDVRTRVEMTLVDGRLAYPAHPSQSSIRVTTSGPPVAPPPAANGPTANAERGTRNAEPGTRNPEPAPGALLAIRAGRVLTVSRGVIEDGVVLVRDGRIIAVGRDLPVPPEATVLDASDGMLMPGMIDAQAHLGLHADTDGVTLSPPAASTGSAPARASVVNALDPRDPAFGEALRAGVTAVVLAPEPSGNNAAPAALLRTAACPEHLLPCEERVLRDPAALSFNLRGGSPRMARPWALRNALQQARGYLERRARYEREHREWERARAEALAKGEAPPEEPEEVRRDENRDALAPLFRGAAPVYLHAGRADEIATALRVFGEEFGFAVVLVQPEDGFRMPEEIRRGGAFASLGPALLEENVAPLARAGVPLLAHSGGTSGSQFLRQHAAFAVRHGLDPAEALRMLTLNPARALQVDDRLGSIEVGKEADLVILSGDPLDLRSRVLKVIVQGRVVHDAS